MNQADIERAFAERQARNRAQMGLPDGGWTQEAQKMSGGLLSPQSQGLLGLAAGLMAPTRGGTFGGAFANGIQGYQSAYGNAQQMANDQDRLKMAREKYAFEMEGAKRKRKEQEELERLSMRYLGIAPHQEQAPVTTTDPNTGVQVSTVAKPEGSTGGPKYDDSALKEIAAKFGPEYAQQLQSLVMPAPRKTTVVNGRLVDSQTGDLVADYSAADFDPSKDLLRPDGTPNQALIDIKRGLARDGAVRVQNVMPGQQRAEDKEEGSYLVKDYYENVVPSADAGRQLIPQYESLRNTIQQGAFTTGAAPGMRQALAEGLALLGVEKAGEAATSAQTMRAALSEVVLAKQIAQKGPQTEADAKRIEATSASLGNTPEANLFLVDMAEAISRRDIARERFFAEWKSEKGTYQGARSAWNRNEGGKSIFDSPLLQKYRNVSERQRQERPPLESFFK